MDMYLASAEENKTNGYFLDFQKIRNPPRLMNKPLIDWRVSGKNPSQSRKRQANQKRKKPSKRSLYPNLKANSENNVEQQRNECPT